MTSGEQVPAAWDCRAAVTITTRVSVAALAAASAVGALAPGPVAAAGPAVLVVAAVLALPHGAVDHLAVGWRRGRSGPGQPVLLVGYAMAALAAAALAVAWPRPSVLVLLGLSVAHFAEGESAYDRLRGGRGLRLPAWAIAACVVVGPLLLRPAAARPLLASLDPGLPGLLDPARGPVILALAALVVTGLGVALRAGSHLAAAEVGLVAAATALGPPLLVFAVWFAGWHAPRHLVRLAVLQPAGDGRARRSALLRGAAGPTVVAAAGIGGLAAIVGGVPSGALVALLALTVPHAAVVAWLGSPTAGPRGINARRRGAPGPARQFAGSTRRDATAVAAPPMGQQPPVPTGRRAR